ncbi:hypothetical protein ACOME3_008510 [Neoechinorhynchus agilis]
MRISIMANQLVFMIAEKPSLAESISRILSHGNCKKARSNPNPVFEWMGDGSNSCGLHGQCLFRMTSVCGHVMSVDFISKYNQWEKVDPCELLLKSAHIVKREANPKLQIPKMIQRESNGCRAVVLWLDCDLEGENICFEVLDNVDHSRINTILRARFSSITDIDIKRAFHSLSDGPNVNESMSVDARQELDLRVGCAFTRFQTLFFKNKYSQLDSSCVSYGPCQTPTLGFCVKRYDQIQKFRPQDYWNVCADLGEPSVTLIHSLCPFYDRSASLTVAALIEMEDTAEVVGCKKSEKRRPRPHALNTVELLRVASAKLGIGPAETMYAAERLYTQGLISYPRTETTQYASSFDFRNPLSMIERLDAYREYVSPLLQASRLCPRKGKDSGDHPPITPVGVPSSELSGDMRRLYDYVCRHFIASLSDDCVSEETRVEVRIGVHSFKTSVVQPKYPGWTMVMNYINESDTNERIPSLEVGSHVKVKKSYLKDGQTRSPDFLTESELIGLMEKHGIGTDASIPTHIKNIVDRAYVHLDSCFPAELIRLSQEKNFKDMNILRLIE